jgi:zinc transport system substrate-binding protein
MVLISSVQCTAVPRPSALPRLALALVVGIVAAAVLSGCGGGSGGTGTPGDPLRVVASFYPLQWMAEQVGGDRVEVTDLTKPGAEPHDLELTPRDVGAVQDADVVAYLSQFQPGVDEAVADATGTVFDARRATDLLPAAGEGAAGATDPHFWLDPTKLAEVATGFADALADADPAHAADYRANAEALGVQLADLDAEMEAGLADCRRTDLVTSHEAFGYLARRYGLEQVGITGLTPEGDPTPKQLATVADFVERHGVTTVYFETLTSPAVAQTLAAEAGAQTAVLDPLEGLTDESKGADYLEVMRSNLATLRTGQECS